MLERLATEIVLIKLFKAGHVACTVNVAYLKHQIQTRNMTKFVHVMVHFVKEPLSHLLASL